MRVLYAKGAERPLSFVVLAMFMHGASVGAYADTRSSSAYMCGTQRAPGAISGRLIVPPGSRASVSVYVFESSQLANTYIDSLKSSLGEMEQFERYAHGFEGKGNMPETSPQRSPLQSTNLMSVGNRMMTRMSGLSKRSLRALKVHAIGADQNGSFTCNGLQPGRYELLLEARRMIQPPPALKGLTGPIPQKMYYEARGVVIPKPSKPNTRSLVKLHRFRLMGKSPPDNL